MENLMHFLREQWDNRQKELGQPPLTDVEFIHRLCAMRAFEAAEEAARLYHIREARS